MIYFASNQIVKELRKQANDLAKVRLLPASKAVLSAFDLHPAITHCGQPGRGKSRPRNLLGDLKELQRSLKASRLQKGGLLNISIMKRIRRFI